MTRAQSAPRPPPPRIIIPPPRSGATTKLANSLAVAFAASRSRSLHRRRVLSVAMPPVPSSRPAAASARGHRAVSAAAPSTPSTPSAQTIIPRKKQKVAIIGFDALASILTELLLSDQRKKGVQPKGAFAVRSATKHLLTSFTNSIAEAKKPSPTITPSPSLNHRSTRSSSAPTDPADPSARLFKQSVVVSKDAVGGDACLTPISSTNRGMKRLKYAQIVRLRNQDEFTIVVPPIDRRQSQAAQKFRRLFLQDVKKTMLDGTSLRTAHARDAAFADAIQEFHSNGRESHTLNSTYGS